MNDKDARTPAMGPGRDDAAAKASLEHAWRYFQLHAAQRITVFNYFLVATGLAFAGVATAVQANDWRVALAIPGGVLLAMTAFVCWKLDQRSAFLVKQAEAALAAAEREVLPPSGRLFAMGEAVDSKPRGHWTYGRTFRTVFLMVGIIGLASSAIAAARTWSRSTTAVQSRER